MIIGALRITQLIITINSNMKNLSHPNEPYLLRGKYHYMFSSCNLWLRLKFSIAGRKLYCSGRKKPIFNGNIETATAYSVHENELHLATFKDNTL